MALTMLKTSLLCCLALLLAACGASVSEMRMAHHPPREPGCVLDFVEVDATQTSFNETWEIAGHITISETGIADPFSERYREIVRPRACAMGGEAVAIMLSSTNQGMMGSGSGTVYSVLRHRQSPEPQAPQRF